MESVRYLGFDVHQSTISVAVVNADGKLVMQSVIATHAATILDFIHGLRGTCTSPLKKEPIRPGCTICWHDGWRGWWSAIRARTPC